MSEAQITSPDAAPQPRDRAAWLTLLKRLLIWGAFLAVLHLTRDFFFVGFMTFLFSYLALSLVDFGMNHLSRNRERLWLRRLLTITIFLLAPFALLIIGSLIGPRIVAQTKQLGEWIGHVSPETASTQFLESYIGPFEFRQTYHGPQDPNYVKDLEAFRSRGVLHVKAYNEFPDLEAWVEGGFSREFAEAERGRLRSRFESEGISSPDFGHWFLTKKMPELQELARHRTQGRSPSTLDPVIRAAVADKPEQVLILTRREPEALAILKQEWIQDATDRGVERAKQSPEYINQLRTVYDARRAKRPESVPYDFDQYLELQKIRPQGPQAFGNALEKMQPTSGGDLMATLKSDFEAAKKHELFQHWISTNPVAQFVRHQVAGKVSGFIGSRLPPIISALVDIPLDLGTALLLSFFICIDFQNLRNAFRRLRSTWLRDVYDEIVPSLANLGTLIGRALLAQGLIALCNAALVYIALTILGVEHEVLLGTATFVLCLVPTLGALMAMAIIATVALFQYDGGFGLALKASAAVVVVLMIENFVLSPRILGRMMELHPVLIIAILPVAQYFFGVWGLILATPVAVFVINVIIFNRGIPGEKEAHSHAE
jgi:predicted PurR-regulated permease PerM